MTITCRRLIGWEDYLAAAEIIRENTSFQKEPMNTIVRDQLIFMLMYNISKLGLESHHYYFGAFDENGKLLAWSQFVLWREKPVFTYGTIFATNSIPLEKVEGTRYAKAITESVDYGFDQMEKLGLTEGYMATPVKSDWQGHLRNSPNQTVGKWEWSDFEVLGPNNISKDPLINYWVVLESNKTPQKVMKFTRKDA